MLHWKAKLFIARMLIWVPIVGWTAYAVIQYWDKITSHVGIGILSVISLICGLFLDADAKHLKKLFPNYP